MSNDSVIDLEIKISHQDLEIEELKKTVFEHTKTIDRLEKELKRLGERIDGISSPSAIGPGNEKPPHY